MRNAGMAGRGKIGAGGAALPPSQVLMLAIMVILGSGAPAGAQNLAQNAHFHTDVAGWDRLRGGALLWTDLADEGDCPGSGSALVTSEPVSAQHIAAISQCISVVVARSLNAPGAPNGRDTQPVSNAHGVSRPFARGTSRDQPGIRSRRIDSTMATFGTLSDRLTETFRNLRTKGKLTPADVDGTVREIRRALLDADVALEVVKDFTGKVRERALGDEVNKALNPAQQVVQIVNEELVAILGGEQRRLEFAKKPPTVIMLAGLQGAGKTTLAGKLAKWLAKDGHTPLLVAADLQRPNAVTQLQVVGEQAGVPVFAPEPGNGVGDPVKVAKDGVKEAAASSTTRSSSTPPAASASTPS